MVKATAVNYLSNLVTESRLRVLAWASLVSEILIVVTGGAVRLTASGLGCPTWPRCTDSDWTTVPEQGIHGLIEFGNRTLTFVLLVIAAAMFLAALVRRGGRKILSTSIWLIFSIVLQAVVGGISVLMKLNPWIVGLHFIISAAMISISALQLWRVYSPVVSPPSVIERRFSALAIAFVILAELIGVVVTGSGPHAGDLETPRNGLNSELWQHFHSYPAYIAIAVTAWLLFIVRRRDVDGYASRLAYWTLFTLILQAAVGILQANTGLPSGLVALHMFLAATACALVTLQWLALRQIQR
jgi:cytochrome c oxidase assembly protein subunit 15